MEPRREACGHEGAWPLRAVELVFGWGWVYAVMEVLCASCGARFLQVNHGADVRSGTRFMS